MRKLPFVLAVLGAAMLCAGLCRAQPMSSLAYSFAARPAADSLSPALDFDVRYEVSDEGPGFHNFNFGVWASGYQAFSDQITDVDHMELGLDLFGRYYRNDLAPISGPAQDHYWELFERSVAAGGAGLTDSERKELTDLVARVLNNHEWIGYTVAGKLVMDQEATDKLVMASAGLEAELSSLSRILDAPFRATREAGDNFVPVPVRVSIGGEYVHGINGRTDDYPQATAGVEWQTRLLDTLYPRVRWNASLTSDEATRPDFAHFLDAAVILPVTPITSVAVGYMVGRVAPNWERVNGFRIGMDVSSW
jgi:hypothetical protein